MPAKQSKSNADSGSVPITSAEEVRLFTGPVTDLTIAAILGVEPTWDDLETAVTFARGEGDRIDRLGHELAGRAARVYEILASDELYANDNDR